MPRMGYDKDGMVATTTAFASTTNPSSGDVLVTFPATSDGEVLSIAWAWAASAVGSFTVQVDGVAKYSFTASANGGADVTPITGRVSYANGAVVTVKAAANLTGTFTGAINHTP